MLQLINKKKIYFYIFSLLFLSTISNTNLLKNFTTNFLINKIEVNAETDQIKNKVSEKISFLLNKNIFLINKKIIEEKFKNLNYIEKIQIKKNYPSTIAVTAKETELVATTFIDQEKYYVGSNGKFINSNELSNKKNLPIIFGKFEIDQYLFLKHMLIKNKIDHKQIIKYYFHKNKRWDIYFKNNTRVKLPEKDIGKALRLYKQFIQNNTIEPFSSIDLRISNRIVLNNE